MSGPPEKPVYQTESPTVVRAASEVGRLIGVTLAGQYRIVEVIGEGGIGIVYRAQQITVGRDVAVKILKKQFANDELAVRRFETEAQAISRLRHPNTLRLYDCQRTPDGELYLVTELLSGTSLADVLRQERVLGADRAVRLMDEVCRSLAEAHAAGIVHRDLKPANIFLDRIGREDVVKVLDFGIAKILQSSSVTRAGAVPGTPQYMSPEQAAAQRIDHRSDLYALGVIFYQLLAGAPPFDGGSVLEILRKHITERPLPFAALPAPVVVPGELERLVFWLLEKAPEDRPQGADELREHLPGILALVAPPPRPLLLPAGPTALAPAVDPSRFGDPEETTSFPGGAPPPPPRPARPTRLWSAVIGAAGVLVGILVGYGATRERHIVIPAGDPVVEAIAAAPPPAPAETRTATAPPVLRATLVTQPPGATVVDAEGRGLGETPLLVQFAEPRALGVVDAQGRSSVVLLLPERDAGRTIQVRFGPEEQKQARPTPRPAHKRRRGR